MKNVFAFEKQTEKFDGEKFIVRRADSEHEAKLKKQSDEEDAFEKASSLPMWLNVCGLVLFLLGTAFLGGFSAALEELSFSEAFARAGWCLILGAVLIAVFGVIYLTSFLRARRAKASPAFAYLKERRDKVDKESFEAMGVSLSAKQADVIGMVYTQKKNGKTYKENGFNTAHVNLAVKVYAENGTLYFAFPDRLFAIPCDKIDRIQRIDKSISTMAWNKEEVKKNFLTGSFVCNGHKIRVKNNFYYSKPYYRMTVHDENYEEYYILIPCYDADTVLPLTGKPVQ